MFSFASPGHFFASLSHDIKVGVTFLQNHQAQIDSTLQVGANVIGALDPALAPLAQVIERAGEAALGEVLAVISKASDAEAAKGIDITLNQAVVQEFKNLLLSFEKIKPGSTIAPANLMAKVAV
jgi:hypothetical protein